MLPYIAETLTSNVVTLLAIQPNPEQYISAYEYIHGRDDDNEAVANILSNIPVSVFDMNTTEQVLRVSSTHRPLILTRLSDHRLGSVFRYLRSSHTAYPKTMAYCVTRLKIASEEVPKVFVYAHICGCGLVEVRSCNLGSEPFDMEYCISLLDSKNMEKSIELIGYMTSNLLVSQSLINWIEKYCAISLDKQELYDIVMLGVEFGVNFEQSPTIASQIPSGALSNLLALINGSSTIRDIERLENYIKESLYNLADSLRGKGCESTRYHVGNILYYIF